MPESPSPKTISQGYVEAIDGTVLSGWAADLAQPGRPAALILVIDDLPTATFQCSEPRADVNALGILGDSLGFRFELPQIALDGEPHRISIRFRSGGALQHANGAGPLGEEIVYRFDPTKVQGATDGLFGAAVRGWAFRTDLRSGEKSGGVTVQVRSGGVLVGQIKADLARNDVAEAHSCPPRVGFLYALPPRLRDGNRFSLEFHVVPEGTQLEGSPFTGAVLAREAAGHLHAMYAKIDSLCTQVYALKHQLRDMLNEDSYTVDTYHGWARGYFDCLRARVLASRRLPEHAALLAGRTPKISVLCPTYKPALAHFVAAIDSVRRQSWKNWELIIVDDGSASAALSEVIADAVASDPRILAAPHASNQGISAATNTAIAAATGDYIALFDHDDVLVDVALEIMALAALNTGAAMLYSDEDKLDESGYFSEPHLKTDWNYRLLLSNNYICHLLLVEAATLRAAGALRKQYDGAQDHDLVLRLSEAVPAARIHHVPEILYHWRKAAGSTATRTAAKSYAVEAGRRAVLDHLARRGLAADARMPYEATVFDISWRFPGEIKVSILIPFKDQVETTRRCVETLFEVTAYREFEVVLIDNWSIEPATRDWLAALSRDKRVRVIRLEEDFNFSRINNLAAQQIDSPLLLFMNNDIFVTRPDWLRLMVDEMRADPLVGIVGVKLIYPNQTVQHAGVVLGVGGIADHTFRYAERDARGYCFRAVCAAEMSAVTAACMLCRADAFRAVGMFDEANLPVAFNDVDLCLKIGRAGYKIVYQPAVVAEHHESLSRGNDLAEHNLPRFYAENQIMWDRWGPVLRDDPFYNPHFSHETGMYEKLSNASLDVARAPSLLRRPPPRATLAVAPLAPILHDAAVRIPLAGENGQSPVAEGATGPRKRSGNQDRGGKRISGKPAARPRGKVAAPTE